LAAEHAPATPFIVAGCQGGRNSQGVNNVESHRLSPDLRFSLTRHNIHGTGLGGAIEFGSLGVAIMALEKELETYRRELPKLLAQEGKYVLISDDEVAGLWETYEDALKSGYDRFGLKPFLVKQVLGIQQVQFFTRDLPACR
jgi:hypothetical protein